MNEIELENLINSPSEALALELKRWIDPYSPEGIAKIVKTCIAMKNNDGGFLLIGFADDGSLDQYNLPSDVETLYKKDYIQGLISRYSSEPFEIYVHFIEKDTNTVVIIEIPSGVKTPIITKSTLMSIDGSAELIKCNIAYVRTLNSNNTVSTAPASYKDWPILIQKCTDNREFDIGRFLRRNLVGKLDKELIELIQPSDSFLDSSLERFSTLINERHYSLPDHGSMEVAVEIEQQFDHLEANEDFLDLLSASNPKYTGWPVWLDSRPIQNSDHHPHIFNNYWEALMCRLDPGMFKHIDYWRMSPNGKFYLYRALQDDIFSRVDAPDPLTELNFHIVIYRVTECIAVAVSYLKAMGASDTSKASFVFRWKKLKNRKLCITQDIRYIFPFSYKSSYQDEFMINVDIPINAARHSYFEYTY